MMSMNERWLFFLSFPLSFPWFVVFVALEASRSQVVVQLSDRTAIISSPVQSFAPGTRIFHSGDLNN